jgi:hypothetical protein
MCFLSCLKEDKAPNHSNAGDSMRIESDDIAISVNAYKSEYSPNTTVTAPLMNHYTLQRDTPLRIHSCLTYFMSHPIANMSTALIHSCPYMCCQSWCDGAILSSVCDPWML